MKFDVFEDLVCLLIFCSNNQHFLETLCGLDWPKTAKMAESVVSLFVDKLSFIIADEANFLLGVEDQLVLLRDELEWMRHFLRDAEKKRRMFQLVELWVTQIRDLAYDAEDVLDAYMLHLEKRRTRNFLSKIIDFPNKVWTLHRIGKKIQQINTRARKISASRSEYNLEVSETTQDSGHSTAEDMASRRRSVPTVGEFNIVGFEKESVQLANWLKDEVPQRQVISIIGMGGLGKTTLAGKIYNNRDVSSHFDIRVWIFVSQEYQERDLLLRALKQVTGDSSRLEHMDSGELKEELRKRLEDKRYFVVIDDIWKVEAWDRISGAFPVKETRSRIILTTRNKEVALHADPSGHNHLELRLLNKDESWELFCKKVFWRSGNSCPPELVELGKQIVDKCCGLPLGIVVIGGLLIGKEMTLTAWSKVLDSATWQLSQDSNHCREILILSYTDLPYNLKSCFLYLGLFPEDFEIKAEKLITLWVAEGFVQVRGEEKLEDVAEDCLEELIQRSMIQAPSRLYPGGQVLSFRVHDLLRDLAISEAGKDRFMAIYTNNNDSTSTTRSRRLAIHSSSTTTEQEAKHLPTPTAPSKFRSLFVFDEMFKIGMYWKSTIGESKQLLSVLDLEGVNIRKGLPKEIGRLIFLHYLGLRKTGIESLPTSIGNLFKLQTLDVQETRIRSLPKAIWKLKNLRHLLLGFDCDKFETVDGVAMKDFCRNLFRLCVSSLIWETLSDVLVQQGSVRQLEVSGPIVVNHDQKNLKKYFPSSLCMLYIGASELQQDPSDVLGSLLKLKALYLDEGSYTGRDMVFSRGQFPQLQYLCLTNLKNLMEWRVEDGAIPSLRKLVITLCQELEKLPDGLRGVTTLQNIELQFMSFRFQDRVKENGEDWDIIKHVPVVTITEFPDY